MIPSMAVVGVVLVVASLGGLIYLDSLYAAQEREVAAERARAGLPPLPPRTTDATPLMGACLAMGGAGTALGIVLFAASIAILL
ncbi:MAG: hypothetical protein M9894_21630 [Planctomycetes bacterium]|nr:hypothetical protein [Planctomycetota bacterium]